MSLQQQITVSYKCDGCPAVDDGAKVTTHEWITMNLFGHKVGLKHACSPACAHKVIDDAIAAVAAAKQKK